MQMSEWERMTEGDQKAFLHIYESQYRSLLSYGFSMTANLELTKDCIQEMFLELWNKHATVNKDVRDVRSYLFTWLRRKMSRELARIAKENSADELME